MQSGTSPDATRSNASDDGPVMDEGAAADLVGREPQLARLDAVFRRLRHGHRATVLVTGEAGIGKTSLLRAAVGRAGCRVAWGTCIDMDGAPGYWPWSQALDSLVRDIGLPAALAAAGDDAGRLASIVPAFGTMSTGDASARERLLLLDAAARFLDSVAEDVPVVVVLDDLHWADESSVALFDFVARSSRPSPVALVAAYRHDELPPPVHARLADLASRSEHVEVGGLDAGAVAALVARFAGTAVDAETAAAIHRRTGGHPFFVRELAFLPGTEVDEAVPVAVRDAIDRRLRRLPDDATAVLEVLALLGSPLRSDLAGAVLRWETAAVEAALAFATRAGVVAAGDDGIAFTHDLLRETIDERVIGRRRAQLHQAIGAALEERQHRGDDVAPAEIARHFVAAIGVDGPARAVRWARAAARADLAALAFVEAAGHLRRLRAAIAGIEQPIDDVELVDVLVAEADAHARAGNPVEARGLLHHAADVADRTDDAGRVAQVALAIASLGAQFAVRRDDIVRRLEHARSRVGAAGDVWEARLTATLARELQHSVPEDRPRAGPLSEQALEVGRRAGDGVTLLTCLLARHDVLWTPGAGAEREAVAREIVEVAVGLGDDERHGEGLLLLANALLEQGSPAYEAALDRSLAVLGSLEQAQHRYTTVTRRACVALVQGRLDDAEQLIVEAAALGDRIREPDTGNVRMSQQLELTRARGRPEDLRAFAVAAIAHWTGAPVHAHAVAAGFFARAGDLDRARQHVDAVVDLGTWRGDRSYLWSVFVRELAVAAIALDDRELAGQLLEDLLPLAGGCGVNGAVVAFAGSHAHTAGLLAAALADTTAAQSLLEMAAATYRRLGAMGWLAETQAVGGKAFDQDHDHDRAMRRHGGIWELSYSGRHVSVPHTKGLADIARMVASPGTDIHVLDLMGSVDRTGAGGEIVDRQALAAYRARLADLAADIDDAERDHDPERAALAAAEREAILDELRRVTVPAGRTRAFANHPAERARKAVSGRVRDAIRKLEGVLPELADHLHRTIVTGTYCRYRDDGPPWRIEAGS